MTWDEEPEPEDVKPADAVVPIRAAEPAKPAEPRESAGPSTAKPPAQRRQGPPQPPWAAPGNHPAAAATALALCLAAPGTGPQR